MSKQQLDLILEVDYLDLVESYLKELVKRDFTDQLDLILNQIIPAIVKKTRIDDLEGDDVISGKYFCNDNVDVREDIYNIFN